MAGRKYEYPHWNQTIVDQFKIIRNHPDFNEDMELIYSQIHASDSMTTSQIIEDLQKEVSRDTLIHINLMRLNNKYEVSGGMYELFKQYLVLMDEAKEEQVDLQSINVDSLYAYLGSNLDFPPLFLVSRFDNSVFLGGDENPANSEVYSAYRKVAGEKRLFIEITPNITKDDLLHYIDQNYKRIENKLDLIAPNRTRRASRKTATERDYEIIRVYKEYINKQEYNNRVYASIYEHFQNGKILPHPSEETIQSVVKHYKKQKKLWDILPI